MTEYKARIEHKRDTDSNWLAANPVVLNGEIILVDTDDGELRAKIGDGVKTYDLLPFSDEALRSLVSSNTTDISALYERLDNFSAEIDTDPTLTQDGLAADAKVTGEKIDEINGRLSSMASKKMASALPYDGIALADTMYFLGEITSSLIVGFPAEANQGDMAYVSFHTGENIPAFAVKTDNVLGLKSLTMRANRHYELIGLWNGLEWVFAINEVAR